MAEEEQKAWWLEQAQALLTAYHMPDAKIEWLAYTHNAVFDVLHKGGHFVLRVHDKKAKEQLSSESMILQQLIGSQIGAPYPKRVMGDPTLQSIGLLLTHLDGTSRTSESVSSLEMTAIGAYLAKMHSIPIAAEHRPRLDYEGLFGENGIYYPGEAALQVFTDAQIRVMDAAAEKVKLAMDELGTGESEFGLIHGDLLLKNILFHEGEVRALDFEY
jgi:Ser/Thr protein kinase RdoA (MazF antagonist)